MSAPPLLPLVTPWAVTALGPAGEPVWRTSRLAVDGLRVDEAADGWPRGVADPDSDEPRDVAGELATGELVGGAGLV